MKIGLLVPKYYRKNKSGLLFSETRCILASVDRVHVLAVARLFTD